MMSVIDKFLDKSGAFGTELDTVLHNGTFSGWRRCRCPKCSDSRRKKADRCLAVRHPEEGISMSSVTTAVGVQGSTQITQEITEYLTDRGWT